MNPFAVCCVIVSRLLSVSRSGLRVPIAYSLLGGGVRIPELRICWTLDSVPLRFKNHYIVLALGPHPMELVLRPAPLCATPLHSSPLKPLAPRDASSPVPLAVPSGVSTLNSESEPVNAGSTASSVAAAFSLAPLQSLYVRLCVCRSEERRGGKECRSRWSPDH